MPLVLFFSDFLPPFKHLNITINVSFTNDIGLTDHTSPSLPDYFDIIWGNKLNKICKIVMNGHKIYNMIVAR